MAIIRISRVAAPAVINKPLDDAGSQRIIMDVIGKLLKVSIVFNQDALHLTDCV